MNVPILTLETTSRGKQKNPRIFSPARYAIVTPKVFCEAKMHQIYFPEPAEELTTLPQTH